MRKITTLLIMIMSICTHAQDGYYGGYTPSATTAPTAAKVTAVGGATVNRATGTVQQSIPIHTISQNGVSWNIGLQYSYAGLQVMAEPSPIGLGWDLAATGMVSREVRGLPDDHPKGYHGSENIRQQLHLDTYYDFNRLGVSINDPITRPNYPETNNKKVIKEHHAYLLAQGLADGEPDVFRVSAGGLNFSFKLGENLQPVLLSHHNVKVSFSWDQIEVTDSEGVVYIFAAKEIFTPIPEDDIFGKDIAGNPTILPIDPIYSYTRSWYLTRIIPPNTTQEITFNYQDHLFQTKAFLPKIYSYKGLQSEFLKHLEYEEPTFVTVGSAPDPELLEGQDPYVYTHTRLDVDVTKPVLTNITFAEGSLDFITKTVPTGMQHQYERIELKDFNTTLINTYQLTTSGNRRLLTDVSINGEFAYGFEYYHQNDLNAIPAYAFDQDEVFSKMDYWGFYTGVQATEDVLEENEENDPVFNATLSGALQKIRYKTGGYTEIMYQSNVLPRIIDYIIRNSISDDKYTHTFTLESNGANSIGVSKEKAITRTFDAITPISIHHTAKTTGAEGVVKIKIFKHGSEPSTVSYYDQTQSTFAPYLDLNIKPNQEENDTFIPFNADRSRFLNIEPGTYTFYVQTNHESEASIFVNYLDKPGYRKEAYNQPYGGIRVASIKSTAPDTAEHTVKEFSYTDDNLLSSGKIYSVLKELPQEEVDYETRTDFENPKYLFYVEGRGLPMYYSQVSESIVSTKDGSKNGKTVYTFEEPYFFDSELDFRTKEYYDRMPKGANESGIRIASTKAYKFKKGLEIGVKEILISEKTYEYNPVVVNRDTFGNSLDVNYPYAIKVISKTGVKRNMHYPDWILWQYQLGKADNVPIILLQDFEDKYINGTQYEFENYAKGLLSATGMNSGSLPGTRLRQMAVGVTNIEGENELGFVSLGRDHQLRDVYKHKLYTTLEYKETNVQYLRSKVTTKTYSDIDPNQFATTVQEYAYDDNNQLVEQTTTDSKGDTKKVQYFYPYHPAVNNTALVTDNRISSPVKTETFHQNQKQSTALVNFRQWDTGEYLPETIQAAKEDASLRDQTVYHKYDGNGNPLETSAREGVHTIYVWGYQETAPIAVIANATYIGMPAEVQSLVTAAQQASNQDVSAETEQALRTALDALRNHPYFANAQMTTYTYDPLIGMTTTTDVRNRTTYYAYDHLHRLIQVKDNEDKVLQKYTYNYSNQ